MKKILKICMLWTALALPGILLAAPAKKANPIKQVSIRLEMVARSPISSTINNKIQSVRFTNSWLLVFVDYTPGSQADPQWLDNVNMKVKLLLLPFDKKADSQYVIFSGETTFRQVMADGRRRTAMMVLPPQFLERYFAKGKKVSLNTHIIAKAEFTSESGTALSSPVYYSAAGKTAVQTTFEKALKNPKTSEKENALLLRDKSPWRFMNYDQSDLVLDHAK